MPPSWSVSPCTAMLLSVKSLLHSCDCQHSNSWRCLCRRLLLSCQLEHCKNFVNSLKQSLNEIVNVCRLFTWAAGGSLSGCHSLLLAHFAQLSNLWCDEAAAETECSSLLLLAHYCLSCWTRQIKNLKQGNCIMDLMSIWAVIKVETLQFPSGKNQSEKSSWLPGPRGNRGLEK